MDFGSKYVYKYDHSESESVSDDDDHALGHDSDALFMPQIRAREEEHPHQHIATTSALHKRKRLRKPDTNVISIKFNRLLQPGDMHAGDPVYCTDCGAIASHLSQFEIEKHETKTDEPPRDSESKWFCEFCNHMNMVDLDQGDLPRNEDATYLIAPAPVVHGSDMSGVDDSIVLFLIDISGSMSLTTLVHGTFKLPNALKQEERAAEAFGGAHMIKQHNQTHVSRLQGVQMAVDANLDKLVKDTPTRRAALLTFNHEITYYGDGTRDTPLVIRGDKLNNENDLLHEAEKELNNELKPVSQTKAKLTERVYDLEEGGQTALGPAVIFALSIASKRKGSKIVICTDGLANRGLGNLETAQDQKATEAIRNQALGEGNQFYAELTERARAKGTSISVITIKGTDCLLPIIGQMADGTGGNVTIVDLLNMRDQFASILEQKIIATNVEATLIVHRGLYIRNPDNLSDRLDLIKRDIGNVTKQTEVTFEFGVRRKDEVKQKYNIDLDGLKYLPFQVQVNYTAVDGSKALRVLTQQKETTADREIAEVHAARSVIAENHIRNTANDMMAAISDDEESGASSVRLKWATPIVQKQRMQYMDNLNRKVRSRGGYDADQFNERRWNMTSSELQSHVTTTRVRKSDLSRQAALTSKAPPPPLPAPSSTGHFSIASERDRTSSTENTLAILPASLTSSGKRSYGFATSNLSHFTDQHSENLYRFKNMSSDYMREESPERDDGRGMPTNLSHESTIKRADHDDHPRISSASRRSDAKQMPSTHGANPLKTTEHGEVRRPPSSSTASRLPRIESTDDDDFSAMVTTRRAGFKRNDDTKNIPSHPNMHTREFVNRKNDGNNQSSGLSNMNRLAEEQHNDARRPPSSSNTNLPTPKHPEHPDANRTD